MSKVTGTIRKVYAECEYCPNKDHVILFELDTRDHSTDPTLTAYPRLNPRRSIWQRVKIAFGYIFHPYAENSCHYDEVILSQNSVLKLAKLVDLYSWVMAIRHAKRAREKLKK